jgi:hypothetical protein
LTPRVNRPIPAAAQNITSHTAVTARLREARRAARRKS